MTVDETVAAQAPPGPSDLPRVVAGQASFSWWGLLWLIATEATLFAALIASYFYLRFQAGPAWPPDGIADPELGLPLVMTALLLSSSVPVHIADRGIRQGHPGRLKAGLAAAFLLGAAFLLLTWAVEWPKTLREFGPTTNAYGSLYFTLTGFHGLHVLVGLAISAWVQVRAWRGAFDADRHVSVQLFAMYWHFVDVVWVFVLATVYLSPHLS
jgi:heme/copper-type cytochrome/quinol oxidase subunit 3